ncbi:toxin-antitoxin system, toxin component [Leptospira levettii]|uniref:DUF5615 family PIN-like protein n=1 Tax=Leptospira levettii TaxID=2023178 RepID=UPI000C2AF11C|nr:DUF5615 family PIN-like protein [Leptospira levettii]MCW7475406.1 DUF5615 family PIN-like protein [Leptospira levettii]PJZ99639.1 toxin-antitoxin system, toxin component [Leptospira levettii]
MQVKILADENIDFRLIKLLRQEGHNVFSVLEEHHGITDLEVINLAMKLDSILLTLDKDFGEWVFAHKEYSKGIILLRYNSKELFAIFQSLNLILKERFSDLIGKFVVLSKNKLRIRDIHL